MTRPTKSPLFLTDHWVLTFSNRVVVHDTQGYPMKFFATAPIPPMEKSEAEEAAVKRAGMYPAMEYRVRELRVDE